MTSDYYYHDSGEYGVKVSSEVITGDQDNVIWGTEYSEILEGTDNDDQFGYRGGNDIIYGNKGIDSFTINGVSEGAFSIKTIDGITSLSTYDSWVYGKSAIRTVGVEEFSWGGKTIQLSNDELDPNLEIKNALIFGTVGKDIIVGTSNNDLLDGIGGGDIIDGGDGEDISYIFNNKENLNLHTLEGVTRISSKNSDSEYYNGPTKIINVEKIKLVGSEIDITVSSGHDYNVHGTSNDTITASAGDNIIDGGGGSDTIFGGLGQDKAIFFAGIDDATITKSQGSSGATVSFKEVENTEYAFTTTYLEDIEQIVFADGIYNVYSGRCPFCREGTSDIIEGGDPVELRFFLNEAPNSPVTIRLSSDSILQTDVSELNFDDTNWSTYQSVYVSIPNDEIYSELGKQSVFVELESEDPQFNFQLDNSIDFNIIEDDTPNRRYNFWGCMARY